MKTKIFKRVEVEIKYLAVSAGVRYWEDATIDGVEDNLGELMPCIADDRWCPIIDVDSGKILNWEIGKTAQVHYKVCDDGSYWLLDNNEEVVMEIDCDYVPDMMSPKENGSGDYIIMDIEADGTIKNFQFNTSGFKDDAEKFFDIVDED